MSGEGNDWHSRFFWDGLASCVATGMLRLFACLDSSRLGGGISKVWAFQVSQGWFRPAVGSKNSIASNCSKLVQASIG